MQWVHFICNAFLQLDFKILHDRFTEQGRGVGGGQSHSSLPPPLVLRIEQKELFPPYQPPSQTSLSLSLSLSVCLFFWHGYLSTIAGCSSFYHNVFFLLTGNLFRSYDQLYGKTKIYLGATDVTHENEWK